MTKILLTTFIVVFCGSVGALDSSKPKDLISSAYYFPKTDVCTVMIDYHSSIEKIDKLQGDTKSLTLIRSMLNEYTSNGTQKCMGAPLVRLLAVLIPGKDSYGRPDFGSRINLLKLEVPTNKIGTIVKDLDNISLPKIQSAGFVELYLNKTKY